MSFFLIVAMGMIITLFFSFHLHLIYTGKTTIEYCEKKDSTDAKGNRIWDLGAWNNFEAVLGSNIYLWPFPTAPTHINDGLSFQPNPKYQRK